MELDIPFSDPLPVVEDDDEPSVLEYAREQGLSVDYTTELPRIADICLSLNATLDQDPYDPFEDDLANAVTAAVALTKQRLAVTKDVALLLKSVLSPPEPPVYDLLATDGRQRILDLKQELPILQTDAELDMLSFGTRVEPDFKELRTRLPSEDLDDENDEGFGWPARYFAYPAQCDAKIKSEKLAITRDVLSFLQSAVRDDFTPDDHARIMAGGLDDGKEPATRHLTPPLLPWSPPLTPYIPSSPANHLPLAFESSDSVAAELKALEQHVMAEDSLARQHSGSSDSMLLDVADLNAFFDAEEAVSPHFPDRTSTTLKRRAEYLKVEGPLTPPILSDSPMKKLKSVSFAEMIQVCETLEPWTDEHRSDASETHSTTEELAKEIGPLANEVNRRIENEKLTGADTVARVEVPFVDMTLPVAPWNEYSQQKSKHRHSGVTELEAQMRFLQKVKRNDLRTACAWHGVSDLELSWGWFASPTSTIKLKEKLHGETEFNKIQAELIAGTTATSSNEVWKREGLRILDEESDDDEDELEPAKVEEQNSMEALVRKRKLEIEEHGEALEMQCKQKHTATRELLSNPHTQPRPEEASSQHWQNEPFTSHDSRMAHQIQANPRSQESQLCISKRNGIHEPKEAPTELMFGGFSASTALHKFMETQGKAVKPATTTALKQLPFAPPTEGLIVRSRSPPPDLNTLITRRMITFQGRTAEQPPHSVSEPLPALDLPPCSFIISSKLLQRRPFTKQVEHLYPRAELIYRDYTLPHSISLEADIIFSPSTGLILTTLQQIKQSPLPGQALRSPVKERILILQARYERLVVLISEGLTEQVGYSRPEDARDTESLKGLETFATQLEGDVVVRYVEGGEQALARSVVESMGEYGLPSDGKDMSNIKLFAMETTWEVFLRRAGLNPFAAQAIIASLKTPTIVRLPPTLSLPASYEPQKTVEAAGLSLLLLMKSEDRAKHFQALMGGRRILDRVSSLLDQRWPNAVHRLKM
ncbi:uncharacterized protein EKO05_0009181 [Ascochyta rabiei]|uniref:uncharacterized protein n=1 Tax=Didymella rabiei TaxID=5454 RepID=UPI0021FDB8F0|nr:uncharacterized protein EKO05_0009181 [Ascochyta rabiei]UPX18898.1 hypothetical protein EKO05_0009181 [Ascochyta rabiei]